MPDLPVSAAVDTFMAAGTQAAMKAALALTKGDVGLGNVDNTSDATKNAAAVTMTNHTLGTGTLITLGGDAPGDIYYRTASPTLARLGIGSSGQILAVSAAGLIEWINAPSGSGGAPLDSPAFTGIPTAPTAAPGTNTTQLATCEFVTTGLALKAPINSPTFTGVPLAPTAAPGTNTTQLATCAFVLAGLVSPAFTGTPTAPTAVQGTNTTQIATTEFVTTGLALKAPLASPTFTGTPLAPTAAPGTDTTQLATTAYVVAAVAPKAPLASPDFTGTPTAPTATQGTSTTQLATTAFVTTGLATKQAASANLTTLAAAAPTTTGLALLRVPDPSAIRFIRINADNSVTLRTDVEMRTDIGAGTGGGGGGTRVGITADITTSSNVTGNAAGLSTAIAAGQTIFFTFHLSVATAAAGLKVAINGPAGSVLRALIFCNSTSATGFKQDTIDTLDTLSVALNAYAGVGVVTINGYMTAGGTAGTLQLRWASSTNTQVSTMHAGSFLAV